VFLGNKPALFLPDQQSVLGFHVLNKRRRRMKTKTTLLAALLALSPTLALAEGCNWSKHETTAMSCAEGSVMDEATGTCVPIVTG